jgi:hypothetical protein
LNGLLWFLFMGVLEGGPSPMPEIHWVQEMQRLPEVPDGARPPDFTAAQTASLGRAWDRCAASVLPQVTPQKVRELSRWAKKQMENYRQVKGSPVAFRAAFATPGQLVAWTILEVLPSHSPVVTRWLKLYVTYDAAADRITRVSVTIRGEAQE